MKILIDYKTKKNNKPFFYSLFIVTLIIIAIFLFIKFRTPPESAQVLTMDTPAETHIPIQTWTTPHGMKVLLVSTHELPMVDLRLIFKAGAAYDKNLLGLSELTSRVLLQGSTEYDAHTIADRMDISGAKLSAVVDRDKTNIVFRSVSEPQLFENAFATLLSILSTPTFPEEVLVREQHRLLGQLQEQKQSPSKLTELQFFSALYGQHPYAQPVLGTIDTIPQITRDDLILFSDRYYTTQNAVLAIVGDIDLTQAHALIDRLEKTLPTDIPAAEPLATPALPMPNTIHIPFPSTQTHILYGTLALSWTDPDFFPLYVGHHILGGGSGLVSILAQEVREKQGLAYDVRSQLIPLLQTGPFIVSAQTRNEASDNAIAIIQQLLKEFIENGPTPEQLQAAQSNMTGNFILRLNSNMAVVEQLGLIGFYDLPEDYIASFRAKILAVTPEQVRTAFQERIHLENAILVTAGE